MCRPYQSEPKRHPPTQNPRSAAIPVTKPPRQPAKLRTEPKAHDAWQATSAAGDVAEDHAELARQLLSRIKAHVNKFRSELKPKPEPAEHLRLPEFDRIMRSLLGGGGRGKPPPPVEKRPFSIKPGGELEVVPDGRLRLGGTASVEFSDHHVVTSEEGDEIEVRVRYRFMEDDRLGDSAELDIEPPPAFEVVVGTSDTFRGRLTGGSVARFNYLSQEYDSGWTGKLLVNAELVGRSDITHDDIAGEERGSGR